MWAWTIGAVAPGGPLTGLSPVPVVRMAEESLARQTSASVIWMTAQKWVTRVGGFITIIVLTRILTPEDFGTAAAASMLMPLMYVLSDVGFSAYIVQAKSLEERMLDTAFWFSTICGLGLAVLVFAAAPLIATILQLPAVTPLLMVMSTSIILISASSVPTALMRRRMAFRLLAVMELTSAILAQTVAIIVAVLGTGAWALVLQILVSQVVSTVWLWISARWRPGLGFSGAELRRMGAYGINVVGSELLVVSRGWAETAIIVTGLGVREMGYLNIAQRLVTAAQDLTVSALLPVSTVAFSKIRNSIDRLRSAYLRAGAISYAVATPLMIFVAVSASALVPFLFGADKQVSADVTPALAMIVLLNLGASIDYGLHLGIGRPGRWLLFLVVAYSVSLSIVAYSVQFGLMVMVTVWVGTAAMEAIARWFVVGAVVKASPWQAAKPLLGVSLPSLVAAASGAGVMVLFGGQFPFFAIACTGIILVLVYVVALRILRPAVFADVLTVVPARVTARFSRWLPGRRRGEADPTEPADS